MLGNLIRSPRITTTNLVSVSEQILQVHTGVELHLFDIFNLCRLTDDSRMSDIFSTCTTISTSPPRTPCAWLHIGFTALMMPMFNHALYLVPRWTYNHDLASYDFRAIIIYFTTPRYPCSTRPLSLQYLFMSFLSDYTALRYPCSTYLDIDPT